jgi:hypothetical protein
LLKTQFANNQECKLHLLYCVITIVQVLALSTPT